MNELSPPCRFILFGVTGGNLIAGLAINEAGDYTGTMYLYLKTEGEFQKRAHTAMWRTFGVFLVL